MHTFCLSEGGVPGSISFRFSKHGTFQYWTANHERTEKLQILNFGCRKFYQDKETFVSLSEHLFPFSIGKEGVDKNLCLQYHWHKSTLIFAGRSDLEKGSGSGVHCCYETHFLLRHDPPIPVPPSSCSNILHPWHKSCHLWQASITLLACAGWI